MKFKQVFSFFLLGSLVVIPKTVNQRTNADMDAGVIHAKYNINQNQPQTPSRQDRIRKKAKELCNTYIDLVLKGQNNIKNSKGSHNRAVSRELPGAPTGLYCIYGQYTQLNRAIDALGDTLTLIPFDARNACPTFRSIMKKKYAGKEYAGALFNGKMFKSDIEYNRAFQAFLRHNHITPETSDEEKLKIIERFEKNNFSIESLHPGAILIIQRPSGPTNTHAVMFLGRGRVQDKKFVPDSNGRFMYAGYNNETIDDIFKIFNTDHIFAADIQTIAAAEYTKELDKIQQFNTDELFEYIYDMPNDFYAIAPDRTYLQQMAEDKYFNKQNYAPTQPLVQKNMARIGNFPVCNLLPHSFGRIK